MKTLGIFSTQHGVREHAQSSRHSLISWKPIVGGLLVAMICYTTLIALGTGMGGAALSNIMQDGSSAVGLATGAAIWICISALISLAAGSYFAARTSTFITGRIGSAQGLVIAALFFAFMIYGAGQTVGMAGKGIGSIASAIGVSASNLVPTAMVQNTIEDALADSELKSEPSVVVQGLMSRLIQGDNESAKAYLSAQTGLSESELDNRFTILQDKFTLSARQAGIRAADGISRGAWSMFWILITGIGMAVLGGAVGARVNFKKPLADDITTEQVSFSKSAV